MIKLNLTIIATGEDGTPNKAKPEIPFEEGVHDDTTFLKVQSAFGVYVNTTIAICGIVGNVISTIVLRRSGLGRTSNILLWNLAIADALYLVGMVNFSGRIYNNGRYFGWSGSYEFGFFMFILWQLHSMCYLIGHFCSMTIPALITTERLVAILLPLQFNSLVTPFKVWASVAGCATVGTAFALLESFTHFIFYYDFFPEYNATFGVRANRPKSESLLHTIETVQRAFFFMQGILPLLYVTAGCVVIGLKLRETLAIRQEMTSQKQGVSENRTSLMLVLVCVFYVMSSGYFTITMMVPDTPTVFRMRAFRDTFLTINSSANFVIYVAVNKNLRGLYLNVLLCRGGTEIVH